MSARPIIDAGPGLNFLSANRERLLISEGGSRSDVLFVVGVG